MTWLDASFASDNAAGVLPEVLEVIQAANVGAARAYGDDPQTVEAAATVLGALGMPGGEVRFVYGGTGANVLALRTLTTRVDAVLCAATAHLTQAETGAPEALLGLQLLRVPVEQGKITPDSLRATIPPRIGDHRPRPVVLSVTQATEVGTVYTPEELGELCAAAHELGLRVHLDGARLANAAAALGVSLAEAIGPVDVVSLGGTKNGLLGAEAVVWRDRTLARDAGRHRKQITQLASKMRFLAVQLGLMYGTDLWLRAAGHANAMAGRLAKGLEQTEGVRLAAPVVSNGVFAHVECEPLARAQARYAFELWDSRVGLVRWMASWQTTEDQVDELLATLAGG